MIDGTKNTSMKSSIVVRVFKSEMIFAIKRNTIKPNMKLLALVLLILLPTAGYSQKPTKKFKKAKVVKTIKRNVLEIEFGTFNYSSPFLAKKSTFLG
jgi:hypothetical protein